MKEEPEDSMVEGNGDASRKVRELSLSICIFDPCIVNLNLLFFEQIASFDLLFLQRKLSERSASPTEAETSVADISIKKEKKKKKKKKENDEEAPEEVPVEEDVSSIHL